MASVKDLRTKPLSEMSTSELRDYIKRAEQAGYSISESKDLRKAVDLLKVQEPDKYGSETVESAKKKLSSSTTPETRARLGLSGASSASPFGSFGSDNASGINLQQIYDQALNDPELKALEDELNAKKRARDEAEADINNNPYYAEATRVGKIEKLNQRANDEINTLQSQITEKRADAQVKVNIATQQYNIDSQEYQKNLQKLNLLISSGAITGASSSDISQIALATGMSTDMVKSIIETTKAGQVQTSVLSATDDNGNVTVSVINTKTGEVIAQNSLGAIGNKQGSGTSEEKQLYNIAVSAATSDLSTVAGQDGYVAPADYRKYRSQWVALGLDGSDFDKQFKGFINPTHPQDYLVGLGGTPSAQEEYYRRLLGNE